MTQPTQWTIGMMSGTSLDGIDVAAIKTDGISIFEVGPAKFYPYQEEFIEKLRGILGSQKITPSIQEIERQLTHLHADAFYDFLKTFDIPPSSIGIIGFHGHTILHEPPHKFPQGRTWQIGDGGLLNQLTHTPVVGHMRENDVKHGGQGAPLVPVYHQALVKDEPKPVAILNIGGVANITWISQDEIMACDTGPGNALINDWVWKNLHQPFDTDGHLASVGAIDQEVLSKFLQHPYFKITPPKSLDRNEFSLEGVQHLSVEDGAATLTEMTAAAVHQSLKFLPEHPKRWYICGGGRHNTTLLNRLAFYLQPATIHLIEELGNNGDFIEAQAFAFLAVRSQKGLPLTFPYTTGVKHPLTGGILFGKNE